MKNLARIFIALLLIICFLQTAQAELLYEGTRSTADGTLVADDAWGDSGVKLYFKVETLERGGQTYYQYTYTFTDLAGNPLRYSDFLKLESSNSTTASLVTGSSGTSLEPVTDDGFHIWDAPKTAPSYWVREEHLKIGEDGTNGPQVVELADGTVVIISEDAPVWGSFYLRGLNTLGIAGTRPEVLNAGFNDGVFPNPQGGAGYTGCVGNQCFIPVPGSFRPDADPVAQTPIPAAAWLLGSGLIGLIGIRRFRK